MSRTSTTPKPNRGRHPRIKTADERLDGRVLVTLRLSTRAELERMARTRGAPLTQVVRDLVEDALARRAGSGEHER